MFLLLHLLPLVIVSLLAQSSPSAGHVAHETWSSLFKGFPDVKAKLIQFDKCPAESQNKPTGYRRVKQAYTPVVFWHGMGDTAYGSLTAERIALQKRYSNISVLSIQIGENMFEDELAGYLVNVNHQVTKACEAILGDKVIRAAGAFNAVGFSQGAQFLRALIQRCPLRERGIKVKNFISLGGQHQGVFGLPRCTNGVFCGYIRHLLSHAAYEPNVQEHIVQAEYWHDPKLEETYKQKSVFLADINNVNSLNKKYRDNLLGLKNMVLVEFQDDEMVVPRQSSLFGFYSPGQSKTILPLEKTKLYLEDRLGLQKLKLSNRLQMISIPGRHLQYHIRWFMDAIASVYLNN